MTNVNYQINETNEFRRTIKWVNDHPLEFDELIKSHSLFNKDEMTAFSELIKTLLDNKLYTLLFIILKINLEEEPLGRLIEKFVCNDLIENNWTEEILNEYVGFLIKEMLQLNENE